MMAKRPPITDPKQIGTFLTNMKKQMSQIEGEMTMMKNDGQSSLFNNVADMMNEIWVQKVQVEGKLKKAEETLEDIYKGHPDIKISMEEATKNPPPNKDPKKKKS